MTIPKADDMASCFEPSFTPQAEQRLVSYGVGGFFLSGARSPRPRAHRQDYLTNVFGKDAQITVTLQKDYKYRVVAERKKWPRSSPLESTRLTMEISKTALVLRTSMNSTIGSAPSVSAIRSREEPRGVMSIMGTNRVHAA